MPKLTPMQKLERLNKSITRLCDWLAVMSEHDRENFKTLVGLGMPAVAKLSPGEYRDMAILSLTLNGIHAKLPDLPKAS